MKKTLLTVTAIAVSSIYLFAQSELPENYPSVDKVKVKFDFPKEGRSSNKGKGFSANLSRLPNGIKKVALVSFFVFDPGVTKTWTTTAESDIMITTTFHVKKKSTGGLSSDICLGALAKAYNPLINTFKEYGIDLLLPDQYLDTEEKRNYYNNFKVEHDKFDSFLKNMGSANHDVVFGTPDGFIVADIVKEPFANYSMSGMFAVKKTNVADDQIYFYDKDLKMDESLGYDLCSKLGVDAVLVTYMTVWAKNEKEIRLENIRMVMFGPNPDMPENMESKYGIIPHIKGEFYCGVSVNPEMALFHYNKKKPETQKFDFTGFDIIYTAMVKKMGDYIKENSASK